MKKNKGGYFIFGPTWLVVSILVIIICIALYPQITNFFYEESSLSEDNISCKKELTRWMEVKRNLYSVKMLESKYIENLEDLLVIEGEYIPFCANYLSCYKYFFDSTTSLGRGNVFEPTNVFVMKISVKEGHMRGLFTTYVCICQEDELICRSDPW